MRCAERGVVLHFASERYIAASEADFCDVELIIRLYESNQMEKKGHLSQFREWLMESHAGL